jgi:hypothetical protein
MLLFIWLLIIIFFVNVKSNRMTWIYFLVLWSARRSDANNYKKEPHTKKILRIRGNITSQTLKTLTNNLTGANDNNAVFNVNGVTNSPINNIRPKNKTERTIQSLRLQSHTTYTSCMLFFHSDSIVQNLQNRIFTILELQKRYPT